MMRLQNLTGALVACFVVLGVAGLAERQLRGALLVGLQRRHGGVSNFAVNSSNASAVSAVAGTNVLGNPCFALSATKTTAGSMYAWESAQVTNVPSTANSSFTMSALMSNLSDSDSASDNATAGIRFLADTANSNTNAFVVDINDGKISGNPGKVRLVNWVGGTAAVYPSSTQADQYAIGNWNINDPYLVTVVGTYNGSDQLSIAIAGYG